MIQPARLNLMTVEQGRRPGGAFIGSAVVQR
jgi:hypothetical protein